LKLVRIQLLQLVLKEKKFYRSQSTRTNSNYELDFTLGCEPELPSAITSATMNWRTTPVGGRVAKLLLLFQWFFDLPF
jgi:hypothetical protein